MKTMMERENNGVEFQILQEEQDLSRHSSVNDVVEIGKLPKEIGGSAHASSTEQESLMSFLRRL